jgi:hypothetical protein
MDIKDTADDQAPSAMVVVGKKGGKDRAIDFKYL